MQLLAVILGLIGLLAMPGLWRGVRGTTLVAPWCWALASGLTVLVVAIQGASEPLLNYSAAITTLLPAAAIYGAKRPQDRGWQWIVAALFVMLLWPAGESWLLGQSFNLAAQPLRSWFLVVLLAVQCGNWIVTINSGPVLLLTVAQTAMLWPQLPWADRQTEVRTWLYGAALLVAVPWWLVFNLRRANRFRAPGVEASFPSPREIAEWQHFRAAYGVVWALRVTERINEVAKLRRWPWHWSWAGPTPNIGALPAAESLPPVLLTDPGERAAWLQLWENIFRRFLAVESAANAQATENDSQ
jgi:hypothetical protein